MNTTTAADSLLKMADRSIDGQPKGKQEAYDLIGLADRLGVPVDVAEEYLRKGVIRPLGPVNSKHDNGFYVFASEDLNRVRKGGAKATIEKIIEESDGDPAQITMAASHALNAMRQAAKKPGAKREFRAIPKEIVQFSREVPGNAVIEKILTPHLVKLARQPARDGGEALKNFQTHFARYGAPQDEDPTIAQRVGNVAKAGAIGAATYAGLGYLRGRKPGVGTIDAIRNGISANNTTIKNAAGKVGGAIRPGMITVADVLARKAKLAADLLRRRAA